MQAVPWRSGSRHVSAGSLLSVGRAGEDPGGQCCLVWQTRARLSPLGATPAEGAFGIQPSAVTTPRLCSGSFCFLVQVGARGLTLTC